MIVVEKEKAESRANEIQPNSNHAPRKENEIKDKMPQGVESVKPTLVASKTRCMLAALADGSYFAVGRGENRKLYRRSYGMGGHVIGLPVNTAGVQIPGDVAIFPTPTTSMVHAAELVRGAA